LRENDAGSHHAVLHRYILCRGLLVREGLPEAEVAMSFVTALALLCSVLLLIYLVVSLLYPEKF
jgi:K+-transporting ATPase KdpF subunit